MNERAVQFGKSTELVGVLSEPPSRAASAGLPGVLFLNSGILHRVGSCRFHVKIARRLAGAGYTALRFDYSGIGDSPPRPDGLPFEQSSVLEAQEAMDWLTATRGIESFVLGGLCSGADAAYFTAVADPRVVGIFQLDAFAYRTRLYYWHHYAPRLLRLDVWGRFFSRTARRLTTRTPPPAAPAADEPEDESGREGPQYLRHFPRREEVEANLRTLAGRGVRQYYYYSGGFSHVYNYAGQIRHTYPSVDFGDTLHEEFVPASDHIVTNPEHQAFLVDSITGWVLRHWPAHPVERERPVPVATTEPAAAR